VKEILITSSALIVALLAIRFLFRKAVSRRVLYALWALVLVRLLVPASLPAMSLSVLNAGQEVQTAMTKQLEREVYTQSTDLIPPASFTAAEQVPPSEVVMNAENPNNPVSSANGQTTANKAERLTVGDMLTYAWMAGIALMACFFLITNLRFMHLLRKNRTPYGVEGCKHPVYLCDGLPSPCLFGVFRPAIYLNSASVSTPGNLRNVLVHEETHARHLDPLWSLLRCVCLTVYWFNPLVWAAAAASKTDCELACDESTLRRLGDTERLSYGQTLLSLVPVRKGPANPLLSATTMTSGKRRLKDRISRIAEKRKSLAAAVLIVVVLAAVISACTFTAAETKPDAAVKTDEAVRSLTGTELTYLNEEFFNGENFNICNQFLSSLYETPEKMDLFNLFYCGSGLTETISEAEKEAVLAANGWNGEPDCPCEKISRANMDAVLTEYMGLTVEDTDKINLERFTYLEEYDAYYYYHGDTNYRSSVTIATGEREGDLVRLYYDDTYMADGWKCIVLRVSDGNYRFVSNQPSEKPAIPTVLPEGDPVLTISLDGLEPYQAPEVTVKRHLDDCAERLDGWMTEDHVIRAYRSTDGKNYAAVVYNEVAGNGVMTAWDMGCFLTLPEKGSYNAAFFSDLFGHNGLVISYPGMRSESEGTTFNDYYYVTEAGIPVLLARAYGTSEVIDMDGDGENELVSNTQIFSQRNGQVYEADLPALLTDAWPEMSFWDYAALDSNGRYMTVRGFVTMPDWADGNAYFRRYLYFGGGNLLVYKDGDTADHMLEGINAPVDVLAAAKSRALAVYNAMKNGEEGALTDQNFDDWRIASLVRVDIASAVAQWPDLDVEVYSFGYHFHSTKPGGVGVAGGAYIDEEGWFGGFNTEEGPYLVFEVQDGQRVLLDSAIPGDMDTDSPAFQEALIQVLEQNGLLPDTVSEPPRLISGQSTDVSGIAITSSAQTVSLNTDDIQALFSILEECEVSATPYPEHLQAQVSDPMYTITVNFKDGTGDTIYSTETGKYYYRFLDTYGDQGDQGYLSVYSQEIYDLIIRFFNQ
jgi:beta-lactamase regulating signal transducer with metallopeptidase domain